VGVDGTHSLGNMIARGGELVMGIYVPPFTAVTISVADGGKRLAKWRDLLQRIDRAVFEAEFAMIGEMGRKCNTVLIPPGGGDEALRLVKKYKLVFYPIRSVRYYEGYAHTHEPPSSDKDAALFGVACTDLESAKMFAEAYASGNHLVQGMLLGYPSCCIYSFIDFWRRGVYSPVNEIAAATPGCTSIECRIDPLLNPALRYINVKAIPFWPHSYTCKAAKKWAEKFIKKVKKIDRVAYRALLELLREPVEFTQVNAIIEVRVGSPPWMKILAQGFSDDEIYTRLIPAYDPVERYG